MNVRELAVNELVDAIARTAAALSVMGYYMPAFATLLRIEADKYADMFPDDINGGKP